MRSRILALVGILLCSSSLHAAVPIHQWSQRFGSTLADEGYDVAVDASGNVLVTGYFNGTANFGGGPLVSAGNTEIFLAKYDINGVHQWSKRFGSTLTDEGHSVVADASGNVVVTGFFSGTVDFGGGNLVSAGASDIFVAKYDAGGVHLWSKRFGGTLADEGHSVAVDASGNVLVTGYYRNTADFGGGNLVSAGGLEIFVAKYDANGAHQWSKRFGASSSDVGNSVAVDASGNVLLAGLFVGTVNFGGGNLVNPDPTLLTDDVFVAKYDANGVHQWSRRAGSTASDRALSIAVDALGNAVVTGWFAGLVDFGGGNLQSLGNFDFFVAKYDAGGAHQWSQRFGANQSDTNIFGTVDATGNVLVTGTFQNTVDFGGGGLVTNGGFDVFVAKYDAGGVHQWSQRFGSTTSFDRGQAIAVDASGAVLVTGLFAGTVDFGGGGLVGAGSSDIFLAKYADEGPVPVMISAFAATPRGAAIDITWDLWSDEALDRFTLYRRQGASPFVVVASGDVQSTRAYTDTSVEPGQTYHYELMIQTAGGDEFRSPVATATIVPLSASLSQNFPNPFNPQTTIEYTIGETATVSIEVFDASGALVSRLDQGAREAGTYRATWDGRDGDGRAVATGVYFYRLAGLRGAETRKMILLK